MLALKGSKGQVLDPTVQVPAQVIGHWAERAWADQLPRQALEAYWVEKGPGPIEGAASSMARVTGPSVQLSTTCA